MTQQLYPHSDALARAIGLALLASIAIGIVSAVFVADGIDVNTTGDIAGTAANMLGADKALHAKAHLALLVGALQAFVSVGLYVLLRPHGIVLAGWSLLLAVIALGISLFGAVYAVNAAGIAGNDAFHNGAGNLQLPFLKLQALSDHTTFHLGLILSAAANAAVYILFLRSGLIPRLISLWGLFASLFVVTMMVARDYIPALESGAVSTAFILANLVALLATGLYLAIRGVRRPSQ